MYVTLKSEKMEVCVFRHSTKSKIYHLKRFNDQYHNEAVIGKIGVVGKKWADRLALSFNYSYFYKRYKLVFIKMSCSVKNSAKGHSLAPSLEYYKKELIREEFGFTADCQL